jgi:hypothetical protein
MLERKTSALDFLHLSQVAPGDSCLGVVGIEQAGVKRAYKEKSPDGEKDNIPDQVVRRRHHLGIAARAKTFMSWLFD